MKFTRITVDPAQMAPRRASAACAFPSQPWLDGGGRDDAGRDPRFIPDLAAEDIAEALRYAADAVRERELPLAIP